MKKEQIASLGCIFLGIYTVIQSIPLIGNIFQIYAFSKDDPSFSTKLLLSAFLPFAVMMLFGIILMVFNGIFAKRMIPKNDAEDIGQSISSKDIQTIAFSIVGLIMIVLAIPKIFQIYWNTHFLQNAGDERTAIELLQKNWSFALATGMQFIIGFFLFIGSELLSSIWHFIIKRLRFERNITN